MENKRKNRNSKHKQNSEVLFCNNCGKYGHLFHICKIPITSIGVICFRVNQGELEFLMIRRKDTLGYTDFMRGKFSLKQKFYIINMIKQMTRNEKELLLNRYESYKISNNNSFNMKDKIIQLIKGINHEGEFYDLKTIILESNLTSDWQEPEWGFPKGRRNVQESDYDCAVREFSEETGYYTSDLKNIRNIVPFEELFTGSNYNSYRHKYYVMYIPYETSIKNNNYQKSEVSKMEWKTLDNCLKSIRPYNLEKKQVIQNVHNCLKNTLLYSLRNV
uniref:Nudix hydrolase domain-containing protein n=1 Tax=viral metagenome TaxID=1070528 RepID=A0A6C0CLY5_9ZZZZ